MLYILSCLLAILILLYIFLDFTWRIWKRKYSFLPNAPNIPWLGTVPWLGPSTRAAYKALNSFTPKYNYLYILWLGPVPLIRAACVEFIEAVLRSQETITKSPLYDVTHDWLGLGLLTSTGSKWKRRRVALTGAFHFNILNDAYEVFLANACRLVDKLQGFADTGLAIDIQELMSLSTLDVICETSMGVKTNALDSSDSEYVRAVHDVKKLIIIRLLNPILRSKFLYQQTSNGKTFYKKLEILHKFTTGVINDNIAKRKCDDRIKINSNNKNSSNKNLDTNINDSNEEKLGYNAYGRKRFFLDLLLDLYEKGEIDIEGIREEVNTFMFEGHDTTSSALCYTLYSIGRHSHVQERLHHEIDQISSDDSQILDKIRNCKYLDLVIKESLRFHPPVSIYARQIEKDLKINDVTIPANTGFVVEAFGVHMNPKYWDEPNVFRPERFESDTFLKRNPYCYIPFSAGPRNCIGQKFAVMEIKVFIYYIMSKYKIKSVQRLEDMETTFDLITHSENGINIEFYSR